MEGGKTERGPERGTNREGDRQEGGTDRKGGQRGRGTEREGGQTGRGDIEGGRQTGSGYIQTVGVGTHCDSLLVASFAVHQWWGQLCLWVLVVHRCMWGSLFRGSLLSVGTCICGWAVIIVCCVRSLSVGGLHHLSVGGCCSWVGDGSRESLSMGGLHHPLWVVVVHGWGMGLGGPCLWGVFIVVGGGFIFHAMGSHLPWVVVVHLWAVIVHGWGMVIVGCGWWWWCSGGVVMGSCSHGHSLSGKSLLMWHAWMCNISDLVVMWFVGHHHHHHHHHPCPLSLLLFLALLLLLASLSAGV